MTARAALCQHLLSGRVLNIKNCFTLIGLTNAPREISRMIEKPFNVVVSRLPRTGVSRYGQGVTWYDYRLNKDIADNAPGIQLMREYLLEQTTGVKAPPKQLPPDKETPPEIKGELIQKELF